MAKRELFAGNFRAAHAAAQQALREDHTDPEPVMVMAAIAIEHGNAPGAQRLCDLLVGADHSSCWLSVLRARAALLEQDQDAARRHAEEAIGHGTGDPYIANQLGVLLSRTGRHAKAVEPLRHAVNGAPEQNDHRYNLAVALQFDGALSEAGALFADLVRRDPSHARAWLALVQLADTPDPAWSATIEAQFAAATDTENRLLLGHARARLAEAAKDWNKSFDWLQRAKADKRREARHDRAFVDRLSQAAIDSAASASIAAETSGDERPLFIVGMPRSGTTLVERILTSHSGVVSVGELSDFAIVLKRHLGTMGPYVLDADVLETASRTTDLHEVGDDYLRRADALAGDAIRFIDKMPFNSFFVPAILRALPGSRVICLRRSPHDVVMANFRQLFATGFSYYSYAYDLGDTAHFVSRFEAMAGAYSKALPPARYIEVCYEDVVADQRGQTERLLDFCGLEWEDACMEFERNAEPVATASSVQVRSPIYSSSIGQWRRYAEGGKLVERFLTAQGIETASA